MPAPDGDQQIVVIANPPGVATNNPEVSIVTPIIPNPLTVNQGQPGAQPWPITGDISVTVSGIDTITVVSGSSNINLGNFPTVQTVAVQSMPPVTFPATLGTTIASGTSNINIGNFPSTQEVYVVNQPTSSNVNITNASLPVTQAGTWIDNIQNAPGNTLAVSGIVTSTSGSLHARIDNFPTIQTVAVTSLPPGQRAWTLASGIDTVGIANFPSVQEVFVTNQTTGSVSITNTVTVSGSIGVNNFPASQVVISASGTQSVHIDNWPTIQGVAVQNFPPNQIVTVSNPIAVSGIENVTISNTVSISGAVTIASGTSNFNIGNFPTVQTVDIQNPVNVVLTSGVPLYLANTVISGVMSGNITGDQGAPGASPWPMTLPASGVNHVLIDNIPTVQEVYVVNQSSGGGGGGAVTIASGTSNVNIGNFPTVQTVNINNSPTVLVQGLTTSGVNHFLIDNYPTVTTVEIANSVLTTVAVSGTANAHIDNFPTVQTVAGSVTNVATGQGRFLQFAPINASAGVSQLVPATANVATKVVSYVIIASGVSNVAFQSGSSNVTGIMPLAANGGVSAEGQVSSHLFQTGINTALNINCSAAGVTGHLSYFQE